MSIGVSVVTVSGPPPAADGYPTAPCGIVFTSHLNTSAASIEAPTSLQKFYRSCAASLSSFFVVNACLAFFVDKGAALS